ncbi:MAG: SRPBCC family protein [Bacteroidota bacterium]
MKILKISGFIILGLLFLFVIISLFMPDNYKFKRKIIIKAEPEEVFPYFEDLSKWEEWSAWTKKRDSTLRFSYRKKVSGTGAVQKWTSKELGNGSLTIETSHPVKMLSYSLEMDDTQMKSKIDINLVLTKKGTEVRWEMSGMLGFNPAFRWYVFLFLEKYLSPDIEEGLTNLKKIIETKKSNLP